MSSEVNVLKNSLKILHITKRGFFDSITFTLINTYGEDAVAGIEIVFHPVYHVVCRRVLSNMTF